MRKFSYSMMDRLAFYGSYFWYKLILPFEVKSPRWRMWWYELLYTLHKFRDYEYGHPWKCSIDSIETRFGSFKIRTNTSDASNVSPAFERRDINQLLQKTDQLIGAGKRVLFLDIGGDLGTFSVTVGNRFRSQSVDVVCFEPVPASCQLIRENIERNRLTDKVEVMEMALMDEKHDNLRICLNTMTPGSSSIVGNGKQVDVRADRMDSVLSGRVADYDAIVMKIDVEGAEKHVLDGATGLLGHGIETYLMVEDFVDTSIITYLQDTEWEFMAKRTSYNSWWKKIN